MRMVITTAVRSRNPQMRAMRQEKPPTTKKGISSAASPDRVLVTKMQVRSTGRACIIPTARPSYR